MTATHWVKAWQLLDKRERRLLVFVFILVVAAALSSALMVGSILPFLSVLADPAQIREVPALSAVYEYFGFTSDYWFLVALGLASLAVVLLANGIQMLRVYTMVWFTSMRLHSISSRLIAKYLSQKYEFFLDRHSTDMGAKILAEASQVVQQFFRPAAEVCASVFTIVAIVALLLWVNTAVALIAFLALGGVFLLLYFSTRGLSARMGRARLEANKQRHKLTNEAFGGIKEIKLTGSEHEYLRRYSVESRRMASAEAVVGVLAQMPSFVVQAAGFGGMIIFCLLLLGGDEYQTGEALQSIIPTLGVFAFAALRMIPELSKFYAGLTHLNSASVALDEVYKDLVQDLEGDDILRNDLDPIGLKQSLSLSAVDYMYPGAQRTSLNSISVDIQAGHRIGIVGTTGSGKTTLADIMLGLLVPMSGALIADGTKIDKENLRAWQRTVGYVPQEIYLSDASIVENIALGVPTEEIDSERAKRAAKIAQIDTFVANELPERYDTLVGERGVRLSGGQRQRIGIARALYRDAELIVFDEATSALDTMTEREVMSAIDALPGEVTVVLIAHRLSTVQNCDQIIVLDAGQIVGCGKWNELMSSSDQFRKIAERA